MDSALREPTTGSFKALALSVGGDGIRMPPSPFSTSSADTSKQPRIPVLGMGVQCALLYVYVQSCALSPFPLMHMVDWLLYCWWVCLLTRRASNYCAPQYNRFFWMAQLAIPPCCLKPTPGTEAAVYTPLSLGQVR
jgi:hypothetical protein